MSARQLAGHTKTGPCFWIKLTHATLSKQGEQTRALSLYTHTKCNGKKSTSHRSKQTLRFLLCLCLALIHNFLSTSLVTYCRTGALCCLLKNPTWTHLMGHLKKTNEKVPINVKCTNKTPLFPSASKSTEKKGRSDTARVKKERAWRKSSVIEAWNEEKESFQKEL